MAKKQKNKIEIAELNRYEIKLAMEVNTSGDIVGDASYSVEQSPTGDYVMYDAAMRIIEAQAKEIERLTKQKEAAQRISNMDLRDIQVYAARYAHNRMTFATQTVNDFTAKLIEAGIPLVVDQTRDADKPDGTVWVKDGGFGWPEHLIEKYGWDGRKLQK